MQKKTPALTVRGRTPFAEYNGKMYVAVESFTDPFMLLVDGLTFTTFDDNPKLPYMLIDDAIEWCKKEGLQRNHDDFSKMVATMKKAKTQFINGTANMRDAE